MLGDAWPEEPPDPYDDPGDVESWFDLHLPDDGEVPRELLRAFWRLVAVFNVGLFATALGAMLLAFRGQWRLGGSLLAIGLVSLAYGLRRYRHHRATDFEALDGTAGGKRDT